MSVAEPGWTAGWTADTGGLPMHVHVRRHIEQQLAAGTFDNGRSLPSTRHLAVALGVSRNTVNVAYQELVATGVVVSVPRSGLYPVKPTGPDGRRRAMPEAAATGSGAERPEVPPEWKRHIGARSGLTGGATILEPDYLDYEYPFLPGQLELREYPTRSWLRALSRAMDGPHRLFSLRDSADLDDPLLVEQICGSLLQAKRISANPENVLVTSGTQQALSLLAEVLLGPGRTVAVEEPGYMDGARIFAGSGAELAHWPVERDGVAVPERLDVDVVYTTPSHQHPTNVTLSSVKRARLLAAARAEDVLIIEDDFDSEIRYRGAPTWPIKAADQDQRVVYLGTFSKFLAPGLRLGFVVAAPELIHELRIRRSYATKHPSGLLQRGLGLFIESGDYHRALRRHRTHLRAKWERMGQALDEHLDWDLPPPAAGGLSYWITGPEGTDGERISTKGRTHSVLVSPGQRYYSGPKRPSESLRIGFSAIPLERIDRGIMVLSEVIRSAEANREKGNGSFTNEALRI